MSSEQTVQKMIDFIKRIDAATDKLCPQCVDRIRKELKSKELVGEQPTNTNTDPNTRLHKTTGNGVVNLNAPKNK